VKSKHPKIQFIILIAIVILLAHFSSVQGAVRGTFLYNLSNFTGPISFSWPRVFIDQERNEVYVIYQNLIRVFNETGMEVYRFGDELDLGTIVDISLDREGNILLLSHKWSDSVRRVDYEITRCNYRGEAEAKMEIKNVPSEYSNFLPNRMICREGSLVLASLNSMVVVLTDTHGVFKEVYEILPLLELEEKEKQDATMEGFSIDKEGNFLFTVPPLFKAYKISREI
jgi:hypothetical protein